MFWKKKEKVCPFKIGDKVIFQPSSRTKGWNVSFERYRIYPGYGGVVTKIENGVDIYLDDKRGGFHWLDYRFADQKKWYASLLNSLKNILRSRKSS